jgi:hypothetical protein
VVCAHGMPVASTALFCSALLPAFAPTFRFCYWHRLGCSLLYATPRPPPPPQVTSWIRMNNLAPALVEWSLKDAANKIDGALLLAIDEQMLTECGVANKMHRVKFLQAVASIKPAAAAAAPVKK